MAAVGVGITASARALPRMSSGSLPVRTVGAGSLQVAPSNGTSEQARSHVPSSIALQPQPQQQPATLMGTAHPEPQVQKEQAPTAQQNNKEPDGQQEPLTYNAEKVIGNGTFGIVYSAHIVETDETVAIKKVFVDRRYRNRELQVWRELRHPNIVALRHAFYTSGDSQDELYLNMVMEFVPETVYCVMKRYGKPKYAIPMLLAKLYTYQACRALAYLHFGGVVHRDIKPHNLLVDATRGHVLKLCDFGSAAQVGKGRPSLVAYICSRYYRAPELIFGATNYTTAVDLWSIGCVLAEMARGRPLFPGENGVDQLVEIVKVMGAPSRREVLAMNPQYVNFSCPSVARSGWASVFKQNVDKEAIELLTCLLQYDPEVRIRPLEACAHRCFDVLREEHTVCPEGEPFPEDLFNFTNREQRMSAPELIQRLVPRWHKSAQTIRSLSINGQQERAQTNNVAG